MTNKDDDAFNAPDTCKPALIEEDALEINPPARVERLVTERVFPADTAPVSADAPPTVNVELAERFPATCNPAATLEEAEEINPPVNVLRPETFSEPRVPTLVSELLTTEVPRVVASRILALLIKKDPPVARFTFPADKAKPVRERE